MKTRLLLMIAMLAVAVGAMGQSRYEKNIEKAKQGDAAAQYQVGYSYRIGDGVAKDASQVIYWYRKAAEQGYSEAQFGLGVCYHDAIGVAKDYEQAVYWYRKAAEQGNPRAQTNLGAAYMIGEGIAKDVTQGIYWYRKAADQGHASAQNNLASCYKNGTGVTKNYEQAVYWFRKAAEQGHEKAKENLAIAEAKLKEQNQANSSVAQTVTTPKQTVTTPKNQTTTPAATSSDVDKNIPASGRENENLFAVVIGNEHYQEETAVPFACNDAEVFAQYCTRTLGVPAKQIKVYKDATLNNIRTAVNWLKTALDVTGGKGRAIFYYAGHGIPDESQKSALLLPVDGIGSDPTSAYSLERLYSELSSVPSQNTTVFLDACFSGAKREGGMMASARGVAIKVKPAAPRGNLIVFSAAQGDETAYPYTSKQHGMFTYYLLHKLQEMRGDVQLDELASYLREAVRKQSFVENNKVQTPTVSSAMGDSWKRLRLK